MTTDIEPGTASTCAFCNEKITWKPSHLTTLPLWVDWSGFIHCDIDDAGQLHMSGLPEHLTPATQE